MFSFMEKAVLGMAVLRVLSGSIEIFAAFLMLRFNQVDKALIINSSLSLVGPFVMLATTTIGLLGMADKISFTKILWIVVGISFIIIGVRTR